MKLNKLILPAVVTLAVADAGLGVNSVSAITCPNGSIRAGQSADTLAECNLDKSQNTDLMTTVNTIINVVLGVLGLVAVIVIILGGFQYVSSTGDPGKVKKAKDTIMYGIIGLVVALLAFAIVNFVLASVFKPGSTTQNNQQQQQTQQQQNPTL